MKRLNNFSDKDLDDSSDDELNSEEEGEEGEEDEEEEGEEGEEVIIKKIEESEKLSEDESEEDLNNLDEIIDKLKKQIIFDIRKERKSKEENILIKFLDDNNLEKIQNEYYKKIQNLNRNVIVTFNIPEKLIKTRVFTFYKCWKNGYCLNSSTTKIPKNVKKVLFIKS
jgi:hypothetical protein